MTILAGTSRGVFRIDGDGARCTLESRGVRELQTINQRVYAGTGAGLYASADGGSSWRTVGLAEHEVWQVRAAADGTLYAATQPAGLFRSVDGDAWEEVTSFSATAAEAGWCIPLDPPLPGRARALVTHATDPQSLWVGVEVGGIMHTADGGVTWQLTLPGDNPDLHMMFAHPTQPDTLYASTGYGRLDGIAEMVEGNAGVFRSEDAGTSWHYAWRGIEPRYSRPMCIDPRSPFALTVAAAPTAFSNHRQEGGAGAVLFRSYDGGESWQSICDAAHQPSAANFHGLISDPEHVSGVVVGTDSGEVWRVSADADWQLIADELPAVLALTAG